MNIASSRTAALRLLPLCLVAAAVPASADTVSIDAKITDPDIVSTCSVAYDRATKLATPTVVLANRFPGATVVRFSFLTASTAPVSVHDVTVPSETGQTSTSLDSFTIDRDFRSVTCAVRSDTAPAASHGNVLLPVLLGGLAAGVAGIAIAQGNSQPASASAHPTSSPGQGGTATTSLVSVMPQSVSLSGTSNTETITVSEANYKGTFAASASACGTIASVSPASAAKTFTVTGTGGGVCTISFSDTRQNSASLAVSVATSSGTIDSRGRSHAR